jgi:hypothetical protein
MATDPLYDEQLAIVEELLRRKLEPSEYEGFLIVSNRFVDRFGATRIGGLARVFETARREGREALAASLRKVAARIGSYERFAADYPVTIIPPLPAYPLFEVVGIETILDVVYRTLDSGSAAISHIKATGQLPERPLPREVVLRHTPKAHWCSYERWPDPQATLEALQIMPGWSDCEARATLRAAAVSGLAFVPYSDDPDDAGTKGLEFHGYFFEGITEDHGATGLAGQAVQICVYGSPEVALLERWSAREGAWVQVWRR